EERSLPVKLQVVFSLENVVEDPEAGAQAGLAVAEDVPRDSDPRSPIIFVGEIRAARRTRVARKHKTDRSVDEPFRLEAGNEGERASLQITLGGTVFIPDTQRQNKVFAYAPFILSKPIDVLGPNIRGRFAELGVIVGQAKQEICQIIS